MPGSLKSNRLNLLCPCLHKLIPELQASLTIKLWWKKKVVQGEDVDREKRKAQKYKRLYQRLEQRWFRFHDTRFCNVRGSFQSIRDPSFVWKIQGEKRKSPRERGRDVKAFIQEFLPEKRRHTEKQKPKDGFSFEGCWVQEIQTYLYSSC